MNSSKPGEEIEMLCGAELGVEGKVQGRIPDAVAVGPEDFSFRRRHEPDQDLEQS